MVAMRCAIVNMNLAGRRICGWLGAPVSSARLPSTISEASSLDSHSRMRTAQAQSDPDAPRAAAASRARTQPHHGRGRCAAFGRAGATSPGGPGLAPLWTETWRAWCSARWCLLQGPSRVGVACCAFSLAPRYTVTRANVRGSPILSAEGGGRVGPGSGNRNSCASKSCFPPKICGTTAPRTLQKPYKWLYG